MERAAIEPAKTSLGESAGMERLIAVCRKQNTLVALVSHQPPGKRDIEPLRQGKGVSCHIALDERPLDALPAPSPDQKRLLAAWSALSQVDRLDARILAQI